MVINDLDVNLTDEVSHQLEMEGALVEEFGTLSLNVIVGTIEGDAMKMKALVKNTVMLILVDSGSSYCFVSSQFLQVVGFISDSKSSKWRHTYLW